MCFNNVVAEMKLGHYVSRLETLMNEEDGKKSSGHSYEAKK